MSSKPEQLWQRLKIIINSPQDYHGLFGAEFPRQPFDWIAIVFACITAAAQRQDVAADVARVIRMIIAQWYPMIALKTFCGFFTYCTPIIKPLFSEKPIISTETRCQTSAQCASYSFMVCIVISIFRALGFAIQSDAVNAKGYITARLMTAPVKMLIRRRFYLPASCASLIAIRRNISPFSRRNLAAYNARTTNITKSIGASFIPMEVFGIGWEYISALNAIFESEKHWWTMRTSLLCDTGSSAEFAAIYKPTMSRTTKVVRRFGELFTALCAAFHWSIHSASLALSHSLLSADGVSCHRSGATLADLFHYITGFDYELS